MRLPHYLKATIELEGNWTFHDLEALAEVNRDLMGSTVAVTVEPVRSKRSNAQLRWLWGVAYPLIADHCGYDRHEHENLHDDLLSIRFGTTAHSPLIAGASPRIVPSKRTGDLSTAEMSDFMDWLCRYAAEHLGVVIPLPDDPGPM